MLDRDALYQEMLEKYRGGDWAGAVDAMERYQSAPWVKDPRGVALAFMKGIGLTEERMKSHA